MIITGLGQWLLLRFRLVFVYLEVAVARLIHNEKLMTIDFVTIAELKGDQGRWRESEYFAIRARQLAFDRQDAYALAQAEFHIGRALLELGNFAAAESTLKSSLDALTPTGDVKHQTYVMLLLGQAVDKQGRSSEARAIYKEVLRLAEVRSDRRTEAMALVNLGNSHHWAGDFDSAESYFRRALVQYEALNDRRYQTEVKLALGYVAYRLRRFPEAHQFARETYAYFRRTGRPRLAASAKELLRRLDPPSHAGTSS